jgi:hypothetical protein
MTLAQLNESEIISMADTGEKREIKQRAEANEAEMIRESKNLVAKTKQSYRDPTKLRGTNRTPSGSKSGK